MYQGKKDCLHPSKHFCKCKHISLSCVQFFTLKLEKCSLLDDVSVVIVDCRVFTRLATGYFSLISQNRELYLVTKSLAMGELRKCFYQDQRQK